MATDSALSYVANKTNLSLSGQADAAFFWPLDFLRKLECQSFQKKLGVLLLSWSLSAPLGTSERGIVHCHRDKGLAA